MLMQGLIANDVEAAIRGLNLGGNLISTKQMAAVLKVSISGVNGSMSRTGGFYGINYVVVHARKKMWRVDDVIDLARRSEAAEVAARKIMLLRGVL